ncbi:MAG: GTP-binding protein [Deltaproteobacteria bacterium]|nr:GTP-binding protein [Deltaproteobacteria bacterium]
MEERSLHIVIVGHVDHGKSTLVGRLFYDTGSLPPEKLEEIKRTSEALGKELEFAYIMDNLEEEREKGITIDIAHTFFKTEKRRYVIIDAPGHKEFLKNMISGTSQAEAALMLVDVSRGVQEQTLRHCHILSLLGIKQVAVIANKMDLVDYSEQTFTKVKDEIIKVLEGLGITPAFVIPISASKGENVASRTEKLSWYDGPTVLSALDSFNSLVIEEKGLRFPVQDVYEIEGTKVAVGRIEAGVLRKGQDIFILPQNRKSKIVEIKKFMEDGLTEAATGDCVGLVVEEDGGLSRGDILEDCAASTVTDTIQANIFWLIDSEYRLGIPVKFKCATQEVNGKIEKIHRRFDPASVEIVEKDSTIIKPAEIAEVQIKLEKPVAVDKFSEIPELGRFVLEHAGHPVAGGIII